MKIVKIALVVIQIVLVILGAVMMISNIVDTSKLGLPPAAYDQRVFLVHILNAVQVLVVFGAAIAIEPLITKIRTSKD
jgi:hypothetical protein